jgi:uncharacterized phage-associated protein
MITGAQAKYENTILYLCDELGGSVNGKKKLAKLLYYVDFDRYEYKESMRSISGDSYKHWKMGPVPDSYTQIIDTLEKQGKLTHKSVDSGPGYSPTEVFISKQKPDMSVFDKDDIKILNRVVKKYGGLTGKELEILTHQEAPYVATEPDEEIPYDPNNPQPIIGPGKLHRVTADHTWEIWKIEVALIGSGLKPNLWPRMWFAISGDTFTLLTIATHAQNYDNNAQDKLAAERYMEIA